MSDTTAVPLGSELCDGDKSAPSAESMPGDAIRHLPGEGPASTWPDLATRLQELTTEVAGLRETITQDPVGRDREALMRVLHAELQDCRAGTHWRILRPVLTDLVKLLDDLHRTARDCEGTSQTSHTLITSVIRHVEDILDRQGFRRFEVTGDRFDPARQECVRVDPTTEVDLVGLIALRVAPGYASEDRVLRSERVVVRGVRPSPE